MTIEIHSPNLRISDEVIDNIKKRVLDLSHFGENISRAEIFLTEDKSAPGDNKNCKIRLNIFGDSLFVHRTADDFEKAARSAIRILKRRLKKKFEERNLPPDQITSTIKV